MQSRQFYGDFFGFGLLICLFVEKKNRILAFSRNCIVFQSFFLGFERFCV